MTYIAIDFETTWLNTHKDEAIQVWIISYNKKNIKHFESYIKPTIHTWQLKEVVKIITWIDINTLNKAPNPKTVFEKIFDFLSQEEEIIFIWHSISFDIKFLLKGLQKYIKKTKLNKLIKNIKYIDTYPMAQTLLHFYWSYSLETLIENLQKKEDFNNIFQDIYSKIYWNTNTTTFHNALYDSFLSLVLFLFLKNKTNEIIPKLEKYILIKKNWLKNIKTNKKIFRSDIFVQERNKESKFNIQIIQKLPNLTKPLKTTKKISFEDNIENFPEYKIFKIWEKIEKYDIQEINIKDILYKIYNSWKTIFAVAHTNKISIIKKILNNLWINYSFLNQEQIINLSNLNKFLNKLEFTQEEIRFIIKYFSEYLEWYSLIDTNNKTFKQITNFLSEKAQINNENLILTSHYWLYKNLENNNKNFSDYKICFFDLQRRSNSFNKFINQEFDFYTLLEKIEILKYKYEILYFNKNHENKTMFKFYEKNYKLLSQLYWKYSILIWIFGIESSILLKQYSTNKITIHNFTKNPNFYKTNKIWQKIRKFFLEIQENLPQQEIQEILNYFKLLSSILNDNFIIKTKIYWYDWLYYTISKEIKFVDFSEFLTIFNWQKINFLGINLNWIKLKYKNTKKMPDPTFFKRNYIEIKDYKKIFDYISKLDYTNQNIFIISNNKEKTKNLITYLKAEKIDKNFKILWENITWWIKKNISKAIWQWNKIIIGWYNLFLWIKEKWINLSDIIFFEISWPLKNIIINDIKYRNEITLT